MCLKSLGLEALFGFKPINDHLFKLNRKPANIAIPYQQTVPKAWFIRKFNAYGLCYEISICILTGWIVWLMDPFCCENWLDVVIFCNALKQMVDNNK